MRIFRSLLLSAALLGIGAHLYTTRQVIPPTHSGVWVSTYGSILLRVFPGYRRTLHTHSRTAYVDVYTNGPTFATATRRDPLGKCQDLRALQSADYQVYAWFQDGLALDSLTTQTESLVFPEKVDNKYWLDITRPAARGVYSGYFPRVSPRLPGPPRPSRRPLGGTRTIRTSRRSPHEPHARSRGRHGTGFSLRPPASLRPEEIQYGLGPLARRGPPRGIHLAKLRVCKFRKSPRDPRPANRSLVHSRQSRRVRWPGFRRARLADRNQPVASQKYPGRLVSLEGVLLLIPLPSLRF